MTWGAMLFSPWVPCYGWHAGSRMLTQTLARLKDIAPEITEQKATQIAAVFKELWKANGDNISRCVTGTAGVKSADRAITALSRSVKRTVQNNFYDGATQVAIDVLLGYGNFGIL